MADRAPYRWPRTLRGWRALFWLGLGRCPIHHSTLRIDGLLYDDGRTAYCFDCKGIGMWPQGIREALRQNAKAAAGRAALSEGGDHG